MGQTIESKKIMQSVQMKVRRAIIKGLLPWAYTLKYSQPAAKA
jgi:hypothetical protein